MSRPRGMRTNGARARKLRESRGLTQEQLSAALSPPNNHTEFKRAIERIESGGPISIASLKKYADYFKVTWEALLVGESSILSSPPAPSGKVIRLTVLGKLLDDTGISIEDLIRKSHTPHGHILSYIKGTAVPTATHMNAICGALQVSAEEVFPSTFAAYEVSHRRDRDREDALKMALEIGADAYVRVVDANDCPFYDRTLVAHMGADLMRELMRGCHPTRALP